MEGKYCLEIVELKMKNVVLSLMTSVGYKGVRGGKENSH